MIENGTQVSKIQFPCLRLTKIYFIPFITNLDGLIFEMTFVDNNCLYINISPFKGSNQLIRGFRTEFGVN